MSFHRGICTLCTIITRAQYAPGLLPVRSMRQGYAFVSVGMCVCVCVCVWTKKTLVYVSPLENLHKNSLCSFFTEFIVTRRRFLCWQALFERLIHGYLKLRVLVRALYGIVGVSPNLLSMSMSSLSLTCTVTYVMHAQNLIIATVSAFLEAFCDVPINC